MKSILKKRRVAKLRERLLKAKEEQMHHRLLAQHYGDLIHDMEEELDKLHAYHSDPNLINFDLMQKKLPESKIITVA